MKMPPLSYRPRRLSCWPTTTVPAASLQWLPQRRRTSIAWGVACDQVGPCTLPLTAASTIASKSTQELKFQIQVFMCMHFFFSLWHYQLSQKLFIVGANLIVIKQRFSCWCKRSVQTELKYVVLEFRSRAIPTEEKTFFKSSYPSRFRDSRFL